MKLYLLPKQGTFFKANLHCHSNLSDASLSPKAIKEMYRARGYSIIAFSDHDIFIPHPELEDESFLPLNAFEVEINSQTNNAAYMKTCHLTMIALNPETQIQPCFHREKYHVCNAVKHKDLVCFDESLPDYEREYSPERINDMIANFKAGGFYVTYNHPTWSLENYNDYIQYNGMDAMEICNFGSYKMGFAEYNDRVYDDMLRSGKHIFCSAADDNHNGAPENTYFFDSFGGFVMIKADKLEYRTITKALERGNFYSSSGPEIHELYVEDNRVYITFSPSVRVTMTTACRHTEVKYADPGLTITSADFPIHKDDGYIRLTVYDSVGHPAYTNAYFLNDFI